MKYGLIGEKLGHSYSKILHEILADYTYDLMPLTNDEFIHFMEEKDFTAINVTIPYKQAVIPYLDELHSLAKEIGAVNTIVNNNGHYIGYNTDFYGFLYMLEHHDIQINNKKCLILGNGGSTLTVQAVLKHLNAAKIYIVSRKAADTVQEKETDTSSAIQIINYEECYSDHGDAQVIINTTPLGMYPKTDASPLDLTDFKNCEAVVDIIYNPLKTKLTLQAEELGIMSVNGLEMLVAQAKQSIEYFLGKQLDDKVIEDTYQKLLKLL